MGNLTLRAELQHLTDADLIRRAQGEAQIEYVFKHGLFQETTYESLLKQDRKRLHRLVAEILERGADREGLALVLARHWDEAGEAARAFDCYVRAGDAAARVYANVEALMAYDRALELSAALNLDREDVAHLYLRRGKTYELNAQHEAALANYEALEEIGRARADRALELESLLARIPIYGTPSERFDAGRATALIARAFELATALGDRAAQARVLWLRMLVLARTNQPQQAMPIGEQALALARELNLRELTAYAANDLAGVYAANGEFIQSAALFETAKELWRELGNLPMLADNLSSAANYLIFAGELDAVFRLSEEAYEIAGQTGNLWGQSYSLFTVGMAHVERGDFALGMDKMRECMVLGERAGFLAPNLDTQLDLARAYAWLGDTARAVEIAQRVVQAVQRFPLGLPLAYATLAEFHAAQRALTEAEDVLERARETLAETHSLAVYELFVERSAILLMLARGEWAQARAQLEKFLNTMEQLHVRLYLSDGYLAQAQALFELNEMSAANAAMENAECVAREIGSKRMLWQILAFAATLSEARGEITKANAQRGEAREIVEYIAEHAPPELRAGFLQKRDVRAVMASGD